MMKINMYSAKGTKLAAVSLPKRFEEAGNLALLAQAIRVYEAKSHTGLAKTKTRGEVNRTTKKVYKQKGTGGARHGARSAPIYVGGGVAHGPKNVERQLGLPLKMRRKALAIAMSIKAKEGDVIGVSGLSTFKKTKDGQKFMKKLGKKKMTFVVSRENSGLGKILGNIANVKVLPVGNLNAYGVFFGGTVVMDGDLLKKAK